jgi:hypothetical protein
MAHSHTDASPNPRLVSLLAALVLMIISMICGTCTAALMMGFAAARALGRMAGPTGHGDSIMLFITVPAVFIFAFFARRAGVIKAVLGAVAFSVPIVLLCYSSKVATNRPDSVEQIRVVHQVAHITTGLAVFASAFFACIPSLLQPPPLVGRGR